MNTVHGVFLVLHDFVKHEDFLTLANKQSWKLLRISPGDGSTTAHDEVWLTSDERNAIHWIDDPTVGLRFVWVSGPDLGKLLFHIGRRLPAYEDGELIEAAYEPMTHDESVDALFRIAVAFPNYVPEAHQVYTAYFEHPDPLIRKATVQAIAYRLWDESVDLLEKFATEDLDEDVRAFARDILNDVRGANLD